MSRTPTSRRRARRRAWSPHAGAVVGAVFWPVALLVAIEVLARVSWPAGGRWLVVRFGGLGPVAVVAAVVSYRHLSGLLGFYGEDGITSTVGPLAVDGLMVMATGALLATRPGGARAAGRTATRAGRRPRRSPGGQAADTPRRRLSGRSARTPDRRTADAAGGHRRAGGRAAQRASGHGRGGHRRPARGE